MSQKICNKCKINKNIIDFYLYRSYKGNFYRRSECKECSKKRSRKFISKRLSKIEKKVSSLFYSIKYRNKNTNITKNWLKEKIEKGYCEVTGIKFQHSCKQTKKNPFSPSIDRKDPNKSYTKENCQVVVLIYNFAKHSWSHDDVVYFSRKILEKSCKLSI